MKSIASRWLPKQLWIALCPDRVVVAQIERVWRSRVVDKRVVECAGTTADQPWKAPLTVLKEALADSGKANLSATVVLSNHFVRYAIVPWRDSVADDSEQRALARHCFKNIYGDLAERWDIRVSNDGFRRNALASAIDRELLTDLDKIFIECKVTLSSVQPYLMTACNRFRKELNSHQSGCLAVLERGRAALGIFDRTGWQALTVRRIAEVDPDALAPVLAQELQSANLAEPPEQLFVAAVEYPRMEFASGNWSTRTLQLKAQLGFSPLEDARYAMALCGAA